LGCFKHKEYGITYVSPDLKASIIEPLKKDTKEESLIPKYIIDEVHKLGAFDLTEFKHKEETQSTTFVFADTEKHVNLLLEFEDDLIHHNRAIFINKEGKITTTFTAYDYNQIHEELTQLLPNEEDDRLNWERNYGL